MSLISRLLQAAQSWRRRRGGPKTAKRPAVTVEQLDHRQLLSVNFTGNVAVDFPATSQPGVVLFNSSNATVIPPKFPSTSQGQMLQAAIPVEGFSLSEIRVSYDSTSDTLSVGLNQPNYPSTGTPVIAGDADGNGNAGTVNLNVLSIDPFFTEYYNLGGTDEMAAYLDLGNTGTPDVIAGFSPNAPLPNPPTDPNPQKIFEVASAVPSGNPLGVPAFGPVIDNNAFAGNYYLQNSTAHPNFEFSISHFSQLYQMETGKTLTPDSIIGIGATAGSADIGGISDSVIQEETFQLSSATLPVPPELSPPILINPHEHRIIDTNHRDLIRVSIFGTSGFPVSEINPATVELDGVHAVAHITRKVHRNEFPFQTYVFVANQLSLPFGLTTATLTGETYSGFPFKTQKEVLNLPDSAKAFGRLKGYMGNASYYKSLAKLEAKNPSAVISVSNTPVSAVSKNRSASGVAAVKVDYTPKLSAASKQTKAAETVKVRPVVSLKQSDASLAHSNVPTKLRHSLSDFLSKK